MTSARGLYERLISEALEKELAGLADGLTIQREALDPAEAGDRLALYIGRLIARTIEGMGEADRLDRGLELAKAVIATMARELDDRAIEAYAPVRAETLLRSIARLRPDGSSESIRTPDIPLLDTTLLTNSPGETTLRHQIMSEIDSADRIDLVMAFIRRSGTRPFIEALRRHCAEGRKLRVLTTTYTGSTEQAALEELQHLGADVRVSYDTSSTRLHAKAWVFTRETGFSTAYVGSSNLTHTAQVTGLEWNVRASEARNPDVLEKIAAVFASYWESRDFEPFDARRLRKRGRSRPEMTQTRCSRPSKSDRSRSRSACSRRSRLLADAATTATSSSRQQAQARPSWQPWTTHGFESASRVTASCLLPIAKRSCARAEHLPPRDQDPASVSCGCADKGRSLRTRLCLGPEPEPGRLDTTSTGSLRRRGRRRVPPRSCTVVPGDPRPCPAGRIAWPYGDA